MPNIQRPVVPRQNPNPEEHRAQLADRANASMAHDGTVPMTAPLLLISYTVATLPDASDWTGAIVFVSDETGGATIAFSDGSVWRRVQDRVEAS